MYPQISHNSCYCHLISEGSLLQGRENGAVGTRVNGGLCSTELGRHDKTLLKGGASLCICNHNYSIDEVLQLSISFLITLTGMQRKN